MNIPVKIGDYNLKIGNKSVEITIDNTLTTLPSYVSGSKFASYERTKRFKVVVKDENGDLISNTDTTNEDNYKFFISKIISQENNLSLDPKVLYDKLYMKFQKETSGYIRTGKINGIVKNKLKVTYFIDIWSCDKDSNRVISYFESLGLTCKIAPKTKSLGAGEYYVTSVYIPLDYNLTENKQYKNRSMKRKVKLTENDLRRIIKESVKRIISEGGHLYGHDEDGTPFTNSKETYRGVPGSTYIWHGEWSDPEIWYDGVELNANDVEEGLWYSYKDDCEENGEQPTEQGYEQWLDEMGVDWIESQLQDYVWAAQGNP